ncbi:hypothetical protein SCP_0311140 [Sparassis crispa]|uniref:Uncharacterized protein n=1 Tax=Sparassis crispa TaxID=139825 RepID=A0A401GGX9_9APHY|nr:hypothetical protein SCP_0311140 [Sparassis crispa]GBE81385.1 hypothetical protein SCP_0311140 [Sparassis crispa]
MSSLSDHVDRITQLARSIRSAATSTSSVESDSPSGSVGPFTNAVLHTPLGDLIRDIDPAELGLFTLVPPAKPPTHDTDPPVPPHGEIARVEFLGATPLRKPPAPKPGRSDIQRTGEHEPEVYARAALKYLDRYQSIRPMPRASEQAIRIVEQLAAVRESIHGLNNQAKQTAPVAPSQPPLSPKSIFAEEERRIQDAHQRIAELRKHKESLMKRKSNGRTISRAAPKAKPKPQTPQSMSPPDEQEETFWNTPAAAARTLHFTGNSLLDEDVNEELANVSALSFASPVPARTKSGSLRGGRPSPCSDLKLEEREQEDQAYDIGSSVQVDLQHAYEGGEDLDAEVSGVLDDEGAAEDKEQTVVLQRLPSHLKQFQDTSQPDPEPDPRMSSPSSSGPLPAAETPSGSLRRSKVKVTTELEHIVSKIWATIGEVVMPGCRFDVSGAGSNRPPRAKETIAHLQTLSTLTPSPSSPTTSSLSSFSTAAIPPASAPSQPTAQQILTAHMLLALLSTPPQYAMPLSRLKETLATKSAAGGGAVTRPIYGCVAKRLLKIERGGGEQIVKFDV